MTMRPFILDSDTRERLTKLAVYANQNRYSMDDLLDIKNGHQSPPGDNKNYVCHIEVGYRVVFTIEEQFKTIRHLSVSVDEHGKLPNMVAVNEIMKLLGFSREITSPEIHISLEELPGGHMATTVIEPI